MLRPDLSRRLAAAVRQIKDPAAREECVNAAADLEARPGWVGEKDLPPLLRTLLAMVG